MKKGQKESKRRRVTQHSGRKEQHPADWVPVQIPANFEQMSQRWIECEEQNVGWCMLCDAPIRSADDLIPHTNTHNCVAGRELEEKIRLAEAAALNRKPPVQPAKRRSHRDSSGSNSAREPMVGIFWFFNGKLIVDTTLLSLAERYADALTHPKGHPRCWAELQAAGSIPFEIEYDDVPRGRITYDTVRDQFVLFRDRCIPKNTIRQIIRRMHLPKDRTVIALDPHYRCPRCMGRGEDHEKS